MSMAKPPPPIMSSGPHLKFLWFVNTPLRKTFKLPQHKKIAGYQTVVINIMLIQLIVHRAFFLKNYQISLVFVIKWLALLLYLSLWIFACLKITVLYLLPLNSGIYSWCENAKEAPSLKSVPLVWNLAKVGVRLWYFVISISNIPC